MAILRSGPNELRRLLTFEFSARREKIKTFRQFKSSWKKQRKKQKIKHMFFRSIPIQSTVKRHIVRHITGPGAVKSLLFYWNLRDDSESKRSLGKSRPLRNTPSDFVRYICLSRTQSTGTFEFWFRSGFRTGRNSVHFGKRTNHGRCQGTCLPPEF